MAFKVIQKEQIFDDLRYNTENARVLAYTEHEDDPTGPKDRILFQGKNGRYFQSYQKPDFYKHGDNSAKLYPLNKEEAIRTYKGMAVHERFKISENESTDIFDFDEVIKA